MAEFDKATAARNPVKPWAWIVGYIIGGAVALALVATIILLPILIWKHL